MEDEEDDGWDGSDGWDEMEEDNSLADCLFCSMKFKNIEKAVSHCTSDHDFDLAKLKVKLNFITKSPCFSCVEYSM